MACSISIKGRLRMEMPVPGLDPRLDKSVRNSGSGAQHAMLCLKPSRGPKVMLSSLVGARSGCVGVRRSCSGKTLTWEQRARSAWCFGSSPQSISESPPPLRPGPAWRPQQGGGLTRQGLAFVEQETQARHLSETSSYLIFINPLPQGLFSDYYHFWMGERGTD